MFSFIVSFLVLLCTSVTFHFNNSSCCSDQVCVCVGVCGVLRVSKLCERVVCERVVCQEVVCERVVCEQVVYDGRPTEEGGDGTGGCKEKQDPHTKMWGIGSWLYFPCSNMCQIIQLKQIATNVH